MSNNKIERVHYKGASAIAILNGAQKKKALEEMTNNPDSLLDVLVLPSDTEVTISFNVGGRSDCLKPIVFRTPDVVVK